MAKLTLGRNEIRWIICVAIYDMMLFDMMISWPNILENKTFSENIGPEGWTKIFRGGPNFSEKLVWNFQWKNWSRDQNFLDQNFSDSSVHADIDLASWNATDCH